MCICIIQLCFEANPIQQEYTGPVEGDEGESSAFQGEASAFQPAAQEHAGDAAQEHAGDEGSSSDPELLTDEQYQASVWSGGGKRRSHSSAASHVAHSVPRSAAEAEAAAAAAAAAAAPAAAAAAAEAKNPWGHLSKEVLAWDPAEVPRSANATPKEAPYKAPPPRRRVLC